MNSMRASPIPSQGRRHQRKAASGLAMLSMIWVWVSGTSVTSISETSYASAPSYTYPSSPSAQDMVIICPGSRTRVASPVPTTAGIPSSRLTIAAWQVRPPWSVTIPDTISMIGPHAGSVISVTRMSPALTRSASSGLESRTTRPAAIAEPTLMPVRMRGPSSVRL